MWMWRLSCTGFSCIQVICRNTCAISQFQIQHVLCSWQSYVPPSFWWGWNKCQMYVEHGCIIKILKKPLKNSTTVGHPPECKQKHGVLGTLGQEWCSRKRQKTVLSNTTGKWTWFWSSFSKTGYTGLEKYKWLCFNTVSGLTVWRQEHLHRYTRVIPQFQQEAHDVCSMYCCGNAAGA